MSKVLYIVQQCGDCAGGGVAAKYLPFHQAIDNGCVTSQSCPTCGARGFTKLICPVNPRSRASIRRGVLSFYPRHEKDGLCSNCKDGKHHGETCPQCFGTGVYLQDILIFSGESGRNPRFKDETNHRYLADELNLSSPPR